jgi:hypothetical protein
MFNWNDFLMLLEPSVVLMTVSIGVAFGFVRTSVSRHGGVVLYWMSASGLLFFISLAILRWLQGASEIWERWLGALVLWLVYSGSAWLGSRLHDRAFTKRL